MEEDIQRKDGVDYINLSIINIMSSLINEFENTSWKDLPVSEEDGYDKKKKLPKNQLDYYNKHIDKIRDYHVNFLIKDGYIHLPEYGKHIKKNDKKGIKYALDVLDNLHNNNIYHGDILGGDLENEIGLVTINIGNILKHGEYKLIDFGPTKENENRNDEQLLEAEKTLLNRYRSQQSNMTKTKQLNPSLLRQEAKKRYQENRKNRMNRMNRRRVRIPFSYNSSTKSNKSFKKNIYDSPGSDSDNSLSPTIKKNIFDGFSDSDSDSDNKIFGGKKRRRRTKKKRRRKRKSTKKKRRRKRKSTKKKRRKKHR